MADMSGIADVTPEHHDPEDLPARHFAWRGMFVDPDNDPRSDGGFDGERATLVGFLRDQRLTLEMKCTGLDAAQLARRSVAPSTMSLLGLIRHMADVERVWFRHRMASQDVSPLYWSDENGDADFDDAVAEPDVVARAWQDWRDEVTFAEQFVAEAPDLDVVGRKDTVLREVLVHMIEEYARHNGHADLLRERIDGAVGE